MKEKTNFDDMEQIFITSKQAHRLLVGATVIEVEFGYYGLPPKEKDICGVIITLKKKNKLFQIIFEGCEQACGFNGIKFYISKK